MENTQTPSGNRFLISVAVMSATVMQVLDTTIVNVALPHMQGSLGTTADQITWVLTSYMVASGIFMPLTGFFTDRMGRKRYLLLSILGFVVSSALCGLSTNIAEMVLFRLLQGVFGAALVPLSQAIMVDSFPAEERGRAMAIWGMGVMVGPIMGPTLGGWLTESMSWRWTFYINLPVGVLSLFLSWLVVPDTPRRARRMDWTGLLYMSLAIGGLQFVLDRGNENDWFSSRAIQLSAFLSAFGLVAFIIHSLSKRTGTLFDLRIFQDRNFSMASLLIAILGLGMYGNMAMLPLMLEGLLNYPVLSTGLLMAPRGITSMISMMLVGRLANRVDPKLLVGTGILLGTLGSYGATFYSFTIDPWWIAWPIMLQGFGIGLIWVPLSIVAFSTLPPQYSAEAAGLFSLLRTVGSSIGISIVSTVMTRQTQVSWNQLSGHINPFNPALPDYLARLHLNMSDPLAATLLGAELERQARMVAFVDVFTFIAWSFGIMLPLVLMLKSRKKVLAPPPPP